MPRVTLAVIAAVMAMAFPADVPAQRPEVRTVYVAALARGAGVAGLGAADFVVKEDGKVRDIVAVVPATTPMHVALMLDNGGLFLNAIREGAGEFIKTLQGKGEFAVVTIGGRALTLVEFTPSVATLFVGLNKLLARSTTSTDLLDGFLDVTAEFQRRKAARPVIVAIANEMEEVSNTRAPVVLEALQKQNVQLYYIGLGAPAIQGTRPAVGENAPARATDAETGNRNTVLATAPKISGGRSEQVFQESGVTTLMKQFADELASQYAITYSTNALQAKLSVETTRKGVTLRAPTRVGSR
jgi:VWFA-related protein